MGHGRLRLRIERLTIKNRARVRDAKPLGCGQVILLGHQVEGGPE
jgi:hypothetical protein